MPSTLLMILLFQVSSHAGWNTNKPEALLAAEQARQMIYKADISFNIKTPNPLQPEGRTCRLIVSGDQTMLLRGPSKNRDANGKVGEHPGFQRLVTPKEAWLFQDGEISADLYERGYDAGCAGCRDYDRVTADITDYRSLGMYFLAPTIHKRPLEEALSDHWDLPGVYRQEHTDDGLWKVTHKTMMDDEQSVTTWYIDPAMDWNIVRCENHLGGSMMANVVSEYTQYDGIWFPKVSRYTDRNGRVICTLTVTSAKLNNSEIPEKPSPELLGLVSGTSITRFNSEGGQKRLVWVGKDKEPISDREYAKRVSNGELKWDPRHRERVRRIIAEPPPFTVTAADMRKTQLQGYVYCLREESFWKNHIRNFIHDYKLDDEQRNKAWKVFQRCENQRQRYVKSIKAQLAKLKKEALEASDKRFDEIKTQMHKLNEPVHEIFEKKLKPGLMKIPTRKQRAAAEK